MAAPQLIVLDSTREIRAAAAPWDDLWRRSGVALPIARAELVAQWLETFAASAKIRCLALCSDGQFVAVLPLVGGRLKRLLPVGCLPTNDWAWAGDLLIDPAADVDRVAEALAGAVARLPWPLLWLDGVSLDTPRWRSLAAALESDDLVAGSRESFHVNQIAIDHDWPAYQASWSGNHRRQMAKMLRRAAREGGVTLSVYRELTPDRVEPLLRRGFAVEDRSWKSVAGSSVLGRPHVFRFLCDQARQLAEWGQLQLTFLELCGQPIAFEYGWNAAGVYGAAKVGYDEAYARLTPGQLLRYLMLEQMFADPAQRLVDFLGPETAATSRWSTGSYRIGRLVAGNGRVSGRIAAKLYRSWSARRGLPSAANTARPDRAEQESAEQAEVATCR